MDTYTKRLKTLLDHIGTVVPCVSNPISIECYYQKMIYGSYEGICTCCIRCPYQWTPEEIACCATMARAGGLV